MNVLYRVDKELLTITEVDKTSVPDDVPLNVWLPVMHGEGEYCYYEDRYIAYNVLLNLISGEIESLQEAHAAIKEEFEK